MWEECIILNCYTCWCTKPVGFKKLNSRLDGPQRRREHVGEREICCSCRNSNPGPSIPKSGRHTDYAFRRPLNLLAAFLHNSEITWLVVKFSKCFEVPSLISFFVGTLSWCLCWPILNVDTTSQLVFLRSSRLYLDIPSRVSSTVFRRVRNIAKTISYVVSVRPSVPMEQLGRKFRVVKIQREYRVLYMKTNMHF